MSDTIGPNTNITKRAVETFENIIQGRGNHALLSCFLEGRPTTAIVSVEQDEKGAFIITPLFVAVTNDMLITNHDGEAASLDGGQRPS